MMGLIKLATVVVTAAGVALFGKKMLDVTASQKEEVVNLIEESDSNLETTLEIMAENNEVVIKEALVGVDSKRKAQIKKAFETIIESEKYNTQLRFMNYKMWHNERVARNAAYQLLGIATVLYLLTCFTLIKL